jgi:hypothetical protein
MYAYSHFKKLRLLAEINVELHRQLSPGYKGTGSGSLAAAQGGLSERLP